MNFKTSLSPGLEGDVKYTLQEVKWSAVRYQSKGIAMISFKHLVFVTIAACHALPTVADSDKYESGKGYYKEDRRGYKGGEYKEEYWDGNCKVERKWEKNGKYKEKRKCEGPRAYGNYPPPGYQDPGAVILSPGIIIQPPAIIVR